MSKKEKILLLLLFNLSLRFVSLLFKDVKIRVIKIKNLSEIHSILPTLIYRDLIKIIDLRPKISSPAIDLDYKEIEELLISGLEQFLKKKKYPVMRVFSFLKNASNEEKKNMINVIVLFIISLFRELYELVKEVRKKKKQEFESPPYIYWMDIIPYGILNISFTIDYTLEWYNLRKLFNDVYNMTILIEKQLKEIER